MAVKKRRGLRVCGSGSKRFFLRFGRWRLLLQGRNNGRNKAEPDWRKVVAHFDVDQAPPPRRQPCSGAPRAHQERHWLPPAIPLAVSPYAPLPPTQRPSSPRSRSRRPLHPPTNHQRRQSRRSSHRPRSMPAPHACSDRSYEPRMAPRKSQYQRRKPPTRPPCSKMPSSRDSRPSCNKSSPTQRLPCTTSPP